MRKTTKTAREELATFRAKLADLEQHRESLTAAHANHCAECRGKREAWLLKGANYPESARDADEAEGAKLDRQIADLEEQREIIAAHVARLEPQAAREAAEDSITQAYELRERGQAAMTDLCEAGNNFIAAARKVSDHMRTFDELGARFSKERQRAGEGAPVFPEDATVNLNFVLFMQAFGSQCGLEPTGNGPKFRLSTGAALELKAERFLT
jgi:chromosome segregation ATPase